MIEYYEKAYNSIKREGGFPRSLSPLMSPVSREAGHAGPAAVLGLDEAALHQLQPDLVVAVERQQDAVGRN